MESLEVHGFKLIGLKLDGKTTNENGQSGIDCGNLWQRFEKENCVAKISQKVSDAIYAVYYEYEGDHTQPFSYFIGCKVEKEADLPEGFQELEIPSNSYLKVTAAGEMPNCITEAWQKVWSAETNRAFCYDFELYDERTKDWSNAEVDIFVSID